MLGHVADACAQRVVQPGHRVVEEPQVALCAVAQAEQCFQQRGLAGSIAAQQAHHLAGAHLPGQVLQHGPAVVGQAQAVDGDDGVLLRNSHGVS